MRRALFASLAAVALVAGALVSSPAASRANGVPQLVKLTYLDGVSDFGPKDAEGVLEFSFAEAYARVDVKNLPPQAGYTFEGWLLGKSGALLVGKISTNASGIGTLDTELEHLDKYDYDLFVIAARKEGEPEGSRPAATSIAGRFTIIGDENAGAAGGDVRPGALPETGEAPHMSTRERIGRTLTVAAAAGGLAFAFLRITRNRRTHRDQGSL